MNKFGHGHKTSINLKSIDYVLGKLIPYNFLLVIKKYLMIEMQIAENN